MTSSRNFKRNTKITIKNSRGDYFLFKNVNIYQNETRDKNHPVHTEPRITCKWHYTTLHIHKHTKNNQLTFDSAAWTGTTPANRKCWAISPVPEAFEANSCWADRSAAPQPRRSNHQQYHRPAVAFYDGAYCHPWTQGDTCNANTYTGWLRFRQNILRKIKQRKKNNFVTHTSCTSYTLKCVLQKYNAWTRTEYHFINIKWSSPFFPTILCSLYIWYTTLAITNTKRVYGRLPIVKHHTLYMFQYPWLLQWRVRTMYSNEYELVVEKISIN